MTTGVGTVTQGTIGALNAAVGIDALNAGSLAVQITGTYVGALAFQGSIDGTNWFSVNALPVIGGTVVTGNTANGQWVIGAAGLAQFRVICTAYTSGTATVNICASIASQVSTATAVAAGSGGAATIADGADVAQGTTTDAAVTNPASAATEIALLKGLLTQLALSKGSGVVDATTLRAVLASDGPTVSVLGALADAAVADASGSINAHVRQIAKAQADGTQVATAKGDVAHDAVDSGNPIKVGGYANSTAPGTVGNGDRVNAWFTQVGALVTNPYASGNAGDGTSNANVFQTFFAGAAGGPMAVAAVRYNGSTWDRDRANHEVTVLASAARTASVNSADLTNYNARGIQLCIDVTAIVATPSIVVTIQGKCTLSGKYYSMLVSVAITATGTTILKVYPGITASANVAASDALPRIWRVSVAHDDADSITYSISANLIN